MISKRHIHPRITLVGTGPGDPELLTLKALKAIQSADVILYDALVDPVVLDHAVPTCTKIFVGKRANLHRYSQEQINLLMVRYAMTQGHVVRLKGGDPFVFGRGYEELSYARLFNIEVEVVPGISSCIAVPELEGVPLTCRGVNESFWVITGTTSNGNISDDVKLAVQSSATVVILMGIRKIEEIANLFCAAGKKNLPAMVIQNGSTVDQKTVLGTAETIAIQAKENKIGTPGILVFGEVVSLHQEFQAPKSLNLATLLKNRA